MDALRELERDTLRRVVEIGEFGRLGQLRSAAHAAYGAFNDHKGPIDVHLGFTLDIRLRGDKRRRVHERRVDVGALVEPTSDNKRVKNASYSLMICRYADPATSPVVRKVHFDFEPEDFRNPAEPKPSSHLQICGKLSPHHMKAGYTDMRIRSHYPSWEKPRIPMAPTSLALLLNWLMLEFQADPTLQAVLRSPAWRSWVAHAERVVLLPYFENATTFLRSAAQRSRRFFQAHLYGIDTE